VCHLHANFKSKEYKRKTFKDELWGATRASNAMIFQHHMKVIQGMDVGVYRYLNDVNLVSWSRHVFSTLSKSDMLLNNLAKAFNAWIKESRDKLDYAGNDLEAIDDNIPTEKRRNPSRDSENMSQSSE
jgi:hypothetical protein